MLEKTRRLALSIVLLAFVNCFYLAEALAQTVVPQEVQRKVALVVGNAKYKVGPLNNPGNDARDIAKVLLDQGFKVIHREDADLKTLRHAITEFGDEIAKGGVGLFYFSGHGMQVKGKNFLIPVDAVLTREDEISHVAEDIQVVLDKMENAGNGMNFLILDACRTNPFVRSTRNTSSGLSRMEAPIGTLISYATAPGSVASDGSTRNGLYTHHLLQAIQVPNLKAEDVFKRVRTNVRMESKGQQIPWESTSLEGDFYFKKVNLPVVQTEVATPNSTPVKTNAFGYSEGDFWEFKITNPTTGAELRKSVTRIAKLEENSDIRLASGNLWSSDGRPKLLNRGPFQRRYSNTDFHLPPSLGIGVTTPYKYEAIDTYKDGATLRTAVTGFLRVLKNEDVTILAGTFQTTKFERVEIWHLKDGPVVDISTFWFSARANNFVKWEFISRAITKGTIRQETVELTKFNRVSSHSTEKK